MANTLNGSFNNLHTRDVYRISSIDVMRGVIILLMTLDHCRDFFHIYAADYIPEDLRYTTPIVFYTRWVSHFCAPAFVFLTGISALLYQKRYAPSQKEFALYLISRGLVLIVLELTVVRFAWRFSIDYTSIGGLILWGIGWSMIALAGLSFLPRKLILFISILILFFHNFLDTITVIENKGLELIWAFLHVKKFVVLSENFGVNILYPVLPLIGLISLGYYIGKWYTDEYSKEIRTGYLFYIGIGMISLFVSLRFLQLFTEQYSFLFYINLEEVETNQKWTLFFKEIATYVLENYGDPSPWIIQENVTYSMISFFNTTKYPMSLLYILMTIGPVLILLSYFENFSNKFMNFLKIFGQTPLFYYIIHLFFIHALAVTIAILNNLNKWDQIKAGNWGVLAIDYGFSIYIVYLITFFVIISLYPICRAYWSVKSKRKIAFLKYL